MRKKIALVLVVLMATMFPTFVFAGVTPDEDVITAPDELIVPIEGTIVDEEPVEDAVADEEIVEIAPGDLTLDALTDEEIEDVELSPFGTLDALYDPHLNDVNNWLYGTASDPGYDCFAYTSPVTGVTQYYPYLPDDGSNVDYNNRIIYAGNAGQLALYSLISDSFFWFGPNGIDENGAGDDVWFDSFNVELTADIDIGAHAWTGASLQAAFNGNGHTVYNMHVTAGSTGVASGIYLAGFFQQVLTGGSVRNLTVNSPNGINDGINIDNNVTGQIYWVGGIAGYAESGTTFDNVHNDVRIVVRQRAPLTDASVGGIVGMVGNGGAAAVITNSTNKKDIYYRGTGALSLGGIAGLAQTAYIDGVSNTGNLIAEVSEYAFIGGLIGLLDPSTLINSYSTGAINVIAVYGNPDIMVGGLVGLLDASTLLNCYFQNNVTASTTGSGSVAAGGIAGAVGSGSTIANVRSVAAISSTAASGDAFAGGIAGGRTTGANIDPLSTWYFGPGASSAYWDDDLADFVLGQPFDTVDKDHLLWALNDWITNAGTAYGFTFKTWVNADWPVFSAPPAPQNPGPSPSPAPAASPRTGDNFTLGLWTMAGGIALLLLLLGTVLVLRRRRIHMEK